LAEDQRRCVGWAGVVTAGEVAAEAAAAATGTGDSAAVALAVRVCVGPGDVSVGAGRPAAAAARACRSASCVAGSTGRIQRLCPLRELK